MQVEVVYATPVRQRMVLLELPDGTCLREAIVRSGLLQEFPDIDLARQAVGIFGRSAGLDEVLRAGDRVEIYRPLAMDPKEARRARRASRGKGPAPGWAG